MAAKKKPYESPQVVRLGRDSSAEGQCQGNGSGDTGTCMASGNSAAVGCQTDGNSAHMACLPGVGESLAADICAAREDGTFESVAELLGVSGMTTEKFRRICNLVSVRSDVFSVRSFGVVGAIDAPDHGVCRCVSVVIDRTADEVKLHSWRELH